MTFIVTPPPSNVKMLRVEVYERAVWFIAVGSGSGLPSQVNVLLSIRIRPVQPVIAPFQNDGH